MDEFYVARPLKLATTADLEAHLLARSGKAVVVDAFLRFVYGLADPASPPDLWMKDEPTHMGTDLWGGTSWDSPDLWVRVSDDGGLDHQSPEFGQDNWFYARVRNRGAAAAHYAVVFNVKPYAGFEFVYPDDYLPCAAAPRPFEKKGEPEAPYIRVEIAGREFARLVGTPMTLSPLARTDRDATKPLVRDEWHSSANEFEWLEGTLTLGHVDAERSVQGSYEFKTRDGQRWTAAFGARWVPSHGGCG